MNRHTIIVIMASAVIAAPFIHAAWNIALLENLELRSSQHEAFSFFEISNGRSIEVCNPNPSHASFEGLALTMFYEDDNKGTYTVSARTLPPSSLSVLEGSFSSESYAESQYTFLHMDAQFAGTAPIRLDPSEMFVVSSIHTSILGLVPYTITDQYYASDFYNIMNEKEGTFSC